MRVCPRILSTVYAHLPERRSIRERIEMVPLALAALAPVRPWTAPPRPYRAPLALYTSDACVGHQPGSDTRPHPEKPERLANLLRAPPHAECPALAAPQRLGSRVCSWIA